VEIRAVGERIVDEHVDAMKLLADDDTEGDVRDQPRREPKRTRILARSGLIAIARIRLVNRIYARNHRARDRPDAWSPRSTAPLRAAARS
jgi:hypothetical protein